MKRLLTLLLLPLAAHADGWAPNLTTTATWNSNVTNANLGSDRIAALQTQADLLASERYALGRNDAAHVGFHAAADWTPRFNGLTTAAAGVRADWQHKFGLGALAPLFLVELAADAVGAKDAARRGTSTGATLLLRKRFDDRWRATLTQEFTDHAARGAVYDRRGEQTTLELGYDHDEATRVTLAAFRRSGDVVSYATPPRPDLVAVASTRTTVDTFGAPRVAYSVDARTVGGKASLVRALDPDSALVASYEYRETERRPLRYVNHLVSLALVHQF